MILKHNGEYLIPVTEEELEMLKKALRAYREQIVVSKDMTEEEWLELEKRGVLEGKLGWSYEY